MASNKLPRDGGVFYVRGGYYNLNYPTRGAVVQNPNYPDPAGLTPTELAKINATKAGDDDHPSYAHSHLSESTAAPAINAIASNEEIWEHSATTSPHDECDGLMNPVPPRLQS